MTGRAAFQVEVFFDGECPLCRREIDVLKRLDEHDDIRFTDIAAPGFDAAALGTTHAALMSRIQGRLPDGTWIEGVEVFRRLYDTVGFGTLVRLTRLPGVSAVLDAAYAVFARNRLKLTGRCDDACAASGAAPGGRRDSGAFCTPE